MSDARRRETRQKFLLGGLVMRAGVAAADRAFLLGVLIEAARILVGSPEHERLKRIGLAAFRQKPAGADKQDEEKREWP